MQMSGLPPDHPRDRGEVVLESPNVSVSVSYDPWGLSVVPGVSLDAPGYRLGLPWDGKAVRNFHGDPPWTGWRWPKSIQDEQVREDSYSVSLNEDASSHEGTSLLITVRLVDEGTISVEVKGPGAGAVTQCLEAKSGERFLGFGERSQTHCLKKGVIENYVGEGPFQPHEYQFLTDTVPPWGVRERQDATYFPMPWVLSTNGYGVLIDNDEVSYERFRTDSEDRWSIEVESAALRYRIFAGTSPLEALERMTAATGRQSEPERWFFGPWFQTGHENHVPIEEERRQLDALLGTAISAAETHCRYLPMGEDRGHEAGESARTDLFHSNGLAALSYINPLVSCDYPEAFERAVRTTSLQRDSSGNAYVFRAYAGGRVPPHTDESQYDFTSPTATLTWGEIAARIVDAGYDGWMEDFGEYTPLDAVAGDESTGPALHNRYPSDYHAAASEVAARLERRSARRLARFVRSGWTGTAAVAPIVWGGDPTTSWGFDGLRSAMIEGLSMGASGVAMWGSDTGGFFSTQDRLTPDLLRRWIQFSAFSPVMRTKSGGIELPPYRRPQIWDDDVLPTWRRFASWHTRLNDYLMAAHASYRRTGRPIMCAMELAFPEIVAEDQYLFGPDLLVAPILEPSCAKRSVVFPEGRWVDLFDPRRCFDGPSDQDIAVGPDDIPVFVRGGAVLCLLHDDVQSLSPYARVLDDRRALFAFPFGILSGTKVSWTGELGPHVSARSEDDGRCSTVEIEAARPFSFEFRTWLESPPGSVSGADSWSFDSGVLNCSVHASTAVLRVER